MSINIGDKVLTTQGDIGIVIGRDNRVSIDKYGNITNQWIVELSLDGNKFKIPFFEYNLVAVV